MKKGLSFILVCLFSLLFSQATITLNQSTGFYDQENSVLDLPINLSQEVLNSEAPLEGYELSFSWGANNGSHEMYSGGSTPSATLILLVNGQEVWKAITPSNSNTESGKNTVLSGVSFVSGSGNWQMESHASLRNHATIKLPANINTIKSISFKGITGGGGSGGDDFIFQMNTLKIGKPLYSGPPEPHDDEVIYCTPEVPVTIYPLVNDIGASGAIITISGSPTDGTATVVGNTILYKSLPTFPGYDLIYYTICNAQGECSSASITIYCAKSASQKTSKGILSLVKKEDNSLLLKGVFLKGKKTAKVEIFNTQGAVVYNNVESVNSDYIQIGNIKSLLSPGHFYIKITLEDNKTIVSKMIL